MKRILNYRDFNIFTIEKEVWDIPYHNHNFYEIILVEKGSGKHRMNDLVFSYRKNDIFLLTPSDKHEFEIERKTKFIYIKFTTHFFETNFFWLKKQTKEMIELVLKRNFLAENIVKNKVETQHIFQLANMLLYSFTEEPRFKEDMTVQLFTPLLTLLAKNIMQQPANKKWFALDADRISNILSYISVYAMDRERMRIENLAQEFTLAPTYVSIYVKKSTGLSIQQHVLNYKMKAAEKLLTKSGSNINEIAESLGFVDASHFNKIFKKHKGVSPTDFQKKNIHNGGRLWYWFLYYF